MGQDTRKSRADGLDEIVGHGSGRDTGVEVSVNPELVSNRHADNSPVNDVEVEEGSAEDALESGIWIMTTAECG